MDKYPLFLLVIPERSRAKSKRGGKKNRRKECDVRSASNLKFFYSNINGFMSKKESLNQSISITVPDIVCICETKVGALTTPKIPGFEAVYENLKQGKEGLLVAA